MSYALGAAWYDPFVSAVTGSVSGVARQAAAGAVPELKAAVVGAVREVLPDVKGALKTSVVGAVQEVLPGVKTTLSTALSDGFQQITKKNQAVFIGFGVALGLFTIGSLTLGWIQYRRLGKCCPTGR